MPNSESFATAIDLQVAHQLVGKVVDPGPDILPMTFDDIRRGADGVIHTADDVFLNPIVHAKVWILGQEDRFVFTDANGHYTFTAADYSEGVVKQALAPEPGLSTATVADGELSRGSLSTEAPRLSDEWWPFAAALLLLCAEWIARRFAGLR